MNKTILEMAYRHIKHHQRQYLFLCAFIFIMSLAFHMYILCMQSYNQMQKYAYEQEYGSWYKCYVVEDMHKTLEQLSQTKDVEYHFLYQFAYDKNNMTVGFGDEGFYDFCQVSLTDGRFPENDDEVVVSDEFSYEIGQHIYISTSDQIQEMEIVGIVHNSQPIFCDLYVASQEQYGGAFLYSDTTLSIMEEFYEYDTNQYGYDHNKAWVDFDTSMSQMSVFLQAICLMALIFILLTTTLLKKRVKEFALLRAIGMTTKQLFLMILYEMTFCSLIAIFLSTLLAPLLSYPIIHYFSLSLGFYEYVFSLPVYCFYTFMILLCVLAFFIYPAIRSSSQALSGAFDGKQFYYFDVRAKSLKYLYKWRIAWREWKGYKKMNFVFVICICLCSVPFLTNQIIDYHNECTESMSISTYDIKDRYYIRADGSKEILNLILDMDLSDVDSYEYKSASFVSSLGSGTSSGVCKLNDTILRNVEMEGSIPQNDYEILIHADYGNIGEQVTVENQEFIVSGIIHDKELELEDWTYPYSPIWETIVMRPQPFEKLADDAHTVLRIWYEDSNQRDELMHSIYTETKGNIDLNDEGLFTVQPYNSVQESLPLMVDNELLMVGFVMFFFVCYFLNKNYIMNHQRDYQMLRWIGMTKKDMLIKEIYKALFSFLVIALFNGMIPLMEKHYLRISYFPYLSYIIINLICLFVCLIVYVCPILMLWKEFMVMDYGGENV